MLRSVDPATGALVKEYEEASAGKIASALELAFRACPAWRGRPFSERCALFRRLAVLLRERASDHAALMAAEMGKPLAQGRAECEKCALVCDHFAEHAERMLAAEPIATDAARSYVAYRPLGVVLAVMPWNFPFWQVFRFAAPTLDRKSTRLNSSHSQISYAVFCLKKKKLLCYTLSYTS